MHARKEDDAALSDQNQTATYHFGQARPEQADKSRPTWLGSTASAHFPFF
jgi:hypothetical protein